MLTKKLLQIIEKLRNNRNLISNFSWLAFLEVFILLAPLITYPYLVRVLGMEVYGWVITGQVTASYCTVLIDFGFKRISARHIALNSHNISKMGEIISTILILRFILCLISFLIYFIVISSITSYKTHITLFLYSFLTTLSSVLFLDFYFQGIERMKYITIINVIVRGIFIAATFIVIKRPSQYIFVPLLWGIGYILGGGISLWIVFCSHKLSFKIPSKSMMISHLKEGSVIFVSDTLLTIKDKLNYNIMGALIGMTDIVIYDVGSKISNLLLKPTMIVITVLFPSMAKNPSVDRAKKAMTLLLLVSIFFSTICNIFMPWIVKYFIHEDIDLLAIRIYSCAPIILGVSMYISTNVFYAFGKTNLVLKSSWITSIAYITVLSIFYFSGFLTSVLSFVILTMISYLVEAIYRGFLTYDIFKNQ